MLARLALVVAATVLSLALAEGLLRSGLVGEVPGAADLVTAADYAEANWHQAGRDFTWHGQKGRPREFVVRSRWNALGFHDRDHAVEKAPGTRRILFLGDSYVEAVQVPLEQGFPRVLEARLNAAASDGIRYETVSLGVSGAGPKRSLELLRDVGLAFRPDVVVLEFLGFNDVSDDSEELSAAFHRQTRRLEAVSSRAWLPEPWAPTRRWQVALGLGRSRLATLVGQWCNDRDFRRRVAALGDEDRVPHHWLAFLREYDEDDPRQRAWSEGWKATLATIVEVARETRAAGAEFLVVRFTDRWRVAPGGLDELRSAWPALAKLDLDFDKDARMLETLRGEHGVDWVDLFPAFQATWRDDAPLHWRHDTHWNEAGHALVASILDQELRARGWVR